MCGKVCALLGVWFLCGPWACWAAPDVVWTDPEVYRMVFGTTTSKFVRSDVSGSGFYRQTVGRVVQQAVTSGAVQTVDKVVSLAVGPKKFALIGRVVIEAGLLFGTAYLSDWLSERGLSEQGGQIVGQTAGTGYVPGPGVSTGGVGPVTDSWGAQWVLKGYGRTVGEAQTACYADGSGCQGPLNVGCGSPNWCTVGWGTGQWNMIFREAAKPGGGYETRAWFYPIAGQQMVPATTTGPITSAALEGHLEESINANTQAMQRLGDAIDQLCQTHYANHYAEESPHPSTGNTAPLTAPQSQAVRDAYKSGLSQADIDALARALGKTPSTTTTKPAGSPDPTTTVAVQIEWGEVATPGEFKGPEFEQPEKKSLTSLMLSQYASFRDSHPLMRILPKLIPQLSNESSVITIGASPFGAMKSQTRAVRSNSISGASGYTNGVTFDFSPYEGFLDSFGLLLLGVAMVRWTMYLFE